MTIFSGPEPGVEESQSGFDVLTLHGFLAEAVSRFPSREAIVFDDPLRDGETRRWTYARLAAEAVLIADGLIAAGVDSGETVGVLMGNRPEAVASIFGIAFAGGVAAPMSTFAAPPELAHMIRLCGARLVVTQPRLLDRRFGDELAALDLAGAVVLGEESWSAFIDAGRRQDLAATRVARADGRRPDDPALVIFSSGTTSEPKGVLHAHRSPTLQSWSQARIFARTPESRVFSALPLFWTAGFNTALCATLAAGGCWISQEVFEPAGALALMQRERVTEPYTLPHQTQAIAELPDWESADLSALTCVFGKSAYARHPSVTGDPGWVMPVGWGMSEMCSFASAYPSDTPREQMKVGHGWIVPGALLKVVDPSTGRALGVDEEGELCVAGAPLMLGYLGRRAAECLDTDGFFATGDAGHVDANGVVHWSGRRTEMIKTGGANVSPAEIEVQLRACSPVKLARVLGMPDPRLDQVVVAAIVLRDGASATADEIRTFLRERVAAYKVPKRILFFDELPMTGSDTKVRDDELRALIAERLASEAPRIAAIPPAAQGEP